MAKTIYIRCIYGIFGKEIIKYLVINGAYIGFWPTLEKHEDWVGRLIVGSGGRNSICECRQQSRK